jgi:hypothetical protein
MVVGVSWKCIFAETLLIILVSGCFRKDCRVNGYQVDLDDSLFSNAGTAHRVRDVQ